MSGTFANINASLVTLGGECFDIEFQDQEHLPTTTLYLFYATDRVKNRGLRKVSVERFGPKEWYASDFDRRVELVVLNVIRRGFDSGELSFDHADDPVNFKKIRMTQDDFQSAARHGSNDDEIRQFLIHAAFWNTYRGRQGPRFPIQFDSEIELDYLGVTAEVVQRNQWLLEQDGLLEKSNIPGTGRPTSALVKMYESGTRSVTALTDIVQKQPSKKMDSMLPVFDKSQFKPDLQALTSTSNKASPASVIVLDLDEFKAVNDTAGHDVGDKALDCFAQVLRNVVTGKGSAYRNGGDEFCVLLPNHAIREGRAVAERILEAVRAIKIEEWPHGLSTSVGVATFPESTDDPEKIFKLADDAMYRSKNEGRGRVSIAGEAIRDEGLSSERLGRIEDRVTAVDLEFRLDQAYDQFMSANIRNESDETVSVKKIKLSYDGVKLTDTERPTDKDRSIKPRGLGHFQWTANSMPAYKLTQLLRTSARQSEVVLDVEIQVEVLGRLKVCSSRIHAVVEGKQRIWQLP